MGNPKWTLEQEQAISTRGRTLLLSAGAGSGKTTVLVERIVSRLTDPQNPVYTDELVVVTFSNAAAAEMKQRLQQRLQNMQKEEPSNLLLKKQIQRLPFAKISTVHAFCSDLIQEHLWELGLPADIHIGDERELDLLFDESLNEILEENYEAGDMRFLNLVDLLSTGRDDKAVKHTITTLYHFVRSYPFYRDWMDLRLQDFKQGNTPENTIWGDIILSHLQEEFSYVVSLLGYALQTAEQDPSVMEKYQERLREEQQQALHLQELSHAREWDKLVSALQQVRFPTMPAVRKCNDIGVKEQAKALRDQAKDILIRMNKKPLLGSTEAFQEDNLYLENLIEALFAVTKQFDIRYLEKKKEKKLMDFSDLEHFALEMLVKNEGDHGVSTALARQLSERYQEVLVDEYQDTNTIQDLIFRSISKEGKHLFMVGDVKQSIYGFRQAVPEIFLEKKNTFPLCEVAGDTGKIILSKNFRSRKEVTEGINYIFKMLMSPRIGGMHYGEEERLVAASEFLPLQDCGCELDILDMDSLGAEEETAAEVEANYIANRIEEMLTSSHKIQEKGVLRPVRLSDFAILLRSTKGKSELYQKALKNRKLNSNYQADQGFLSTLEIQCVLALLRAIDNPLMDTHLANAMMSPLFDFTAEEMAEMTVKNKNLPLYLRVIQHQEQSERCQEFVKKFEDLRIQSTIKSTAQLLYKIYDKTGIETAVRVMKNGKIRNMNLKLLVDYAVGYDESGHKGVSGFVRFMNRLEESGGDLTPATVMQGGEDAVQIMSIHRSKGLEFPIVFLADCAKGFNKQDLRSTTLLHPKLGFASMRRDNLVGVQYKTTHLHAVRIQAERDMLSEEMRILYVAMTRAKEKFIATVTIAHPEKKIKELQVPLNKKGKLEEGLVAGASGYGEWLIAALLHHPCGIMLRNMGELWNIGEGDGAGSFSIRIIREWDQKTKLQETSLPSFAPSSTWMDQFSQREEYLYPFPHHTKTPTKLAISVIGKNEIEKYRFRKRPVFLQEKGLTGAERGNATHKFMQFADYKELAENPEKELVRLQQGGYLTAKEQEGVEVSKIVRFTQGKLYQRIMAADKIYREYSFLSEVDGEQLKDFTTVVADGCKVALQGIADCVIVEKGIATVIDYKTDFTHSIEELAKKYETQLKIYKMLLPESLGLPVEQCVLYSFTLDCAITL